MRSRLITAKTDWAVTLADAKTHLRVTGTDEDDYILQLIYAAQQKVEEEYGFSLNQETWEAYLDDFPTGTIEIYHWPISSLTSVKYYDTSGSLQTVSSSNYTTDLVGNPFRIVPDDGYDWPDVQTDRANAVVIQYVTGWTDPELVPFDIKQALLLIVGDFYAGREDSPRMLRQASQKILEKYVYK